MSQRRKVLENINTLGESDHAIIAAGQAPVFDDRLSPNTSRSWVPMSVFWIGLLILLVWFGTLDARHLLRSDEGRYAEIAREVFSSGDWVTIRYNGLKYFEKPPFHLWMTALAYHAFGVGDWQARLWVAISGVVGMLMTMVAAHRWYGLRVAALSGLILLATPAWNLAGHFNSLDMSVSAALTCVMAAVLMAQHPAAAARSRHAWMCFAWAAMGVAILTKGLIGIVLPCLALLFYSAVSKNWRVWRRLHAVSGSSWMLAVTLPWFILVSLRNPEFVHFFFVHEHWQRYTSTVHERAAPFWFFAPQLLIGFLPWLGLSKRIALVVREDHNETAFHPAMFMAAWASTIFVFFSLSGSKLPGYIIPIYPALSAIAAVALDQIDTKGWRRLVLVMLSLCALGLFLGPYFVSRLDSTYTPNDLYRQYAHWVAAAFAIGICGFALALRWSRRPDAMKSIVAASLTWFIATSVALVGHEALGRSSSGVDLATSMRGVLTPEMPLYSVRLLDHTLPFYLHRTTILVESPDELEFGTTQEPQKWIPTHRQFVEAWSSGPHALAVMSHPTYAQLQHDHVAMSLVAQDYRRVVVANFQIPPR
jgi:4-amino-4-deoxy-L-arabinose transferase-like glycosyltransferase